MSKIHPECPDSSGPDSLVAAILPFARRPARKKKTTPRKKMAMMMTRPTMDIRSEPGPASVAISNEATYGW
jgi:hypothetical protein